MNWTTLVVDVQEAIATTLDDALADVRVEALEDLSDGLADLPMIQVQFTGYSMDPMGGTDRSSFQGGVKQVEMNVELWGFIRQRGVFADDVVAMSEWADLIRNVLEAQDTTHFGTTGSPRIRSFAHSTETIAWDAADNRSILGFRTTLTLRIF